MKLRLVLCLSLLSLFGCSRGAEPASPPAPPAAAAPAQVAEAPAPTPAPTAPAAPTEAIPPAGDAPVEGRDFVTIKDGKPFQAPAAGEIEVVEFFNYICPGCNAFNPLLEQWKAKQLADVKLVYVPVDFRPDFVPYARAFYAAESLGLAEKTHQAVYKAIHETHRIPAEGDAVDEGKIAGFYAQYGVGAELFEGTMRSFAVDTKIRQGREYMVKSQVTSTPSLVINGRYLVKGSSFEERLRIADHLIARERKAR